MTQPLEEYRAQVVRLLKKRWSVDWEEDGREELIREAQLRGRTPEKFVAWYAEKYDLIDFHEPGLGPHGPDGMRSAPTRPSA